MVCCNGDIRVGGDRFSEGKGGEDAEDFNVERIFGLFSDLDAFFICAFSILMTVAVTFVFLWESHRVLFIDFIVYTSIRLIFDQVDEMLNWGV